MKNLLDWKRVKILKIEIKSRNLCCLAPTWIQCAIGFMTPIVEKRKLCKSINFRSNNRSILPQQLHAGWKLHPSQKEREKKSPKFSIFFSSHDVQKEICELFWTIICKCETCHKFSPDDISWSLQEICSFTMLPQK